MAKQFMQRRARSFKEAPRAVGRVKRVLAGGLVAAGLLAGGAVLTSPLVSAHHPEISASVKCDQNAGVFNVSWTSTSWSTGLQGQNPAIKVSWSGAATGQQIGAYTATSYSFSGGFNVAGTTSGDIDFTVVPTAPWANGDTSTSSRYTSVTLEGDCISTTVEVTPVAPTVTPPTCLANGTISAVNGTGYTWSQSGGLAATVVTATATPGYTLTGQTVYGPYNLVQLNPESTRSCNKIITVSVNFTPPTCTAAGTAVPVEQQGVTWVKGDDGKFTAIAKSGFIIEGQTVFGPFDLGQLDGDDECAPPPPRVETSEWKDGKFACGETTVKQTRTVTTTTFVWDEAQQAWVADEVNVDTQTRVRELSGNEQFACPTTPPTTTPPTTNPPTTAPPSISFGVLGPLCVGDFPYIDYRIDTVGTDKTVAKITLTAKSGQEFVYENQPLTGRILWPGASVNPPDWPGWKLVNGTWFKDTTDSVLREGFTITAQVNPTAIGSVLYPASTSACADPMGVAAVPPAADPAAAPPLATELPKTGGANTGLYVVIAALLILAGSSVTAIARRKS